MTAAHGGKAKLWFTCCSEDLRPICLLRSPASNYVFLSTFNDVRTAARAINLSNISGCADTTLIAEEG